MIKRKGDLFTTNAVCIGHGVNTQGVMGAGIARAFREKFPDNYTHYRALCNHNTLRPGGIFIWEENDKIVFNIASQEAPGPDATYTHLFNAALTAAKGAVGRGFDRIAIPQIGCGIGGLKWERVELVLRAIEVLVENFEWEVWKQ